MRCAGVLTLIVLGVALLPGIGADDDPAPWKIDSVTMTSVPPNAPLNSKKEVVFNGGEPQGILDSTGKLTIYRTDPATRMVLMTVQGKTRMLNRFLWVTVRFDQDPIQKKNDEAAKDKDAKKTRVASVDSLLRKFLVKDKGGRTVGGPASSVVYREVNGKALLDGQYLFVFERDRLPQKPGDIGSYSEWQSLDGLVLSELDGSFREVRQAPLAVKKPAPEKPVAKPQPPDTADKPDPEKAAADRLRLARTVAQAGQVEKAIARCQEIIDMYPKTKAAEEARELLKKLKK